MKKFMSIFAVFRLIICVMGIVLIAVDNYLGESESRLYGERYSEFENRLKEIKTSYAESGDSDKTKYAIGSFIAGIPEGVRAQNNIVIADMSGKIIYKANDLFLSPAAERLNLIWNYSYAIMQDAGTGQNTRLEVRYLDGGSSWPTSNYSKIGEIKDNGSIVDMMDGREPMQYPQNTIISILTVESSQTMHHIIWFRQQDTEDAINSSFSTGIYSYGYLSRVGEILILVYWLLLPVWVFLDARRRQTQPLPWALLVLLTNVVGLIVYWIVQSQNGKTQPASACPACGKAVKKGYPYCPWCAAPLVKACKQCGKPLEPGWTACPWCGNKIE